MKTKITGIALAILLALTFTVPAFAGGWAIVNLDEWPANVVAGEEFEIGFTVLQHGVTPVTGITPIISGTLTGTKESVQVMAKEEGEPGHYVASLKFPKAGEWSWRIDSFGEQVMPPLTVANAPAVAQAANESKPVSNLPIPSLLASGLGLVSIVIGLFAMKTKNLWALTLVLIGLVVGGVGLVSATGQPEVKSEAQAPIPDQTTQVDFGRNLFVAKGCLTCHYHSEVTEYAGFRIDAGPNLTDFSAAPEYLRMRLKDPKSVKSDSKMPQLNLTEIEIEALIAFVNSD
jgi:hypothetical protein